MLDYLPEVEVNSSQIGRIEEARQGEKGFMSKSRVLRKKTFRADNKVAQNVRHSSIRSIHQKKPLNHLDLLNTLNGVLLLRSGTPALFWSAALSEAEPGQIVAWDRVRKTGCGAESGGLVITREQRRRECVLRCSRGAARCVERWDLRRPRAQSIAPGRPFRNRRF